MPAGQLALLASALDAAGAAAVLLDAEGGVRFVSAGARRLLGLGDEVPLQPALLERAHGRGLGTERHELPAGWALLALSERSRRTEVLQIALHDLRSPLGNVRSYAGLLQRGHGTPDKLQRLVEVIARNTERALRLLGLYLESELLQLSGGPMSLHLQPAPLGPVVEAAVASRRALAQERGVTLEIAPLPELTLPLDAERVAAALEVCLDRAIARSPDGGKVQVGLSASPSEARIQLRDPGGPLDPRELAPDRDARILADRRLYPAIGLHVAEAALFAHGGALEVTSSGPGALWQLRLPAR